MPLGLPAGGGDMMQAYGPNVGFVSGGRELVEQEQSPEERLLTSFGVRLAQLIAPSVHVPTLLASIQQCIQEARQSGLGLPEAPRPQQDAARKLELVFAHDCRNHGCNQPQCVLCKQNPARRCTGNFAPKYWVGDRLLAKCEGEIQIELIDATTGQRMTEDLSGLRLEACILDGNKHAARCREEGEQTWDILRDCMVLRNQRREPLLVSSACANDYDSPQVTLKFGGTSAVIVHDMKVTESSESVLAGTKRPPFRLMVRCVRTDGRPVNVRPAISEEFVVVTKRTKNLKKQEIPSLDDPISKLNHIGKETVKKLNELAAAASEADIDLRLPPDLHRVTKVRQFQKLALLSGGDGHMQQRLKQLLKLSKEKWDAACEHAKTAVQADNRVRAWYTEDMSLGLLYKCALGDISPESPVALIHNKRPGRESGDTMEIIPMEQQLPQQREAAAATTARATAAWWQEGHPGWMIFTLGGRHFENLDEIIAHSSAGDGSGGSGGPSGRRGGDPGASPALGGGHSMYMGPGFGHGGGADLGPLGGGGGGGYQRPAVMAELARDKSHEYGSMVGDFGHRQHSSNGSDQTDLRIAAGGGPLSPRAGDAALQRPLALSLGPGGSGDRGGGRDRDSCRRPSLQATAASNMAPSHAPSVQFGGFGPGGPPANPFETATVIPFGNRGVPGSEPGGFQRLSGGETGFQRLSGDGQRMGSLGPWTPSLAALGEATGSANLHQLMSLNNLLKLGSVGSLGSFPPLSEWERQGGPLSGVFPSEAAAAPPTTGGAAQLDAGAGPADDPAAKRRRLEAPAYPFNTTGLPVNPMGPPMMGGLQGFGGFPGGGEGLSAPLAFPMAAPPPQSTAAPQGGWHGHSPQDPMPRLSSGPLLPVRRRSNSFSGARSGGRSGGGGGGSPTPKLSPMEQLLGMQQGGATSMGVAPAGMPPPLPAASDRGGDNGGDMSSGSGSSGRVSPRGAAAELAPAAQPPSTAAVKAEDRAGSDDGGAVRPQEGSGDSSNGDGPG